MVRIAGTIQGCFAVRPDGPRGCVADALPRMFNSHSPSTLGRYFFKGPPMADETAFRLCSCCCVVRPIARFRPRRGGWHGVCNRCHAKRERERRKGNRHRQFDRFATRLNAERRDREARLFCGLMIERMGGLDRFADGWHEQLMAACEAKPGGRVALNSFLAISRLVKACRESAPDDLSNLTDDELRRELEDEQEVVRNFPS